MANRYLVLSDLHLADIEEHADGWKAYKSAALTFDDELIEVVGRFEQQARKGDSLTLLLNGDVLDFDLVTAVPDDPPWPVTHDERMRGLVPTEDKSVWKLRRIIDDHPRLVDALARFTTRGYNIVYLLGNHDRELHFEGVQRALVDALTGAAARQGLDPEAVQIRFEPWFFYVPGEIYAEHGHQFDFYTSFRHQLWPTVKVAGEQRLALPMGNLSNRTMMTRMGFFNPHASDYILNVFHYVAHWLRFYVFSRRSIFFSWLFGSLLVVGRLLATKKRLHKVPPEQRERMKLQAERYALPLAVVERLGALHPQPITNRLFRLLRELWIDRLAIALFMIGGTITLALVPIPLWIKLMVPLTAFPLAYLIYEQLAQGETVFTIENEVPERARAIARALPVRVVTFGHTHVPRQIPLSREAVFVDTGTWAPVYESGDPKRPQLTPGLRNYLVVVFSKDRKKAPNVRFSSWMR